MYVYKPSPMEAWLACNLCGDRWSLIVHVTVARDGEIQESEPFYGTCECGHTEEVSYARLRQALDQQNWDRQDRRYWGTA